MSTRHPMTGGPPAAVWPVRRGGVTGLVGSFGWTRRGGSGEPRIHKGIDWTCALGAPIYAAHDGQVMRDGCEVGRSGSPGTVGYGMRLYIAGAGVTTIYAHLGGQAVRTTEMVRAGQLIGWAGRTGNVGGDLSIPTHLHFEVHVDGAPVNPEWWLHRTGTRHGVVRGEDRV